MPKRKKSPRAWAWKILKICRLGKDPQLTAQHPKIEKAAKIIGPKRAIAFLMKPVTRGENDIMRKGVRLPGSFGSRS